MTVNCCRENGTKMVRAQFCGAYYYAYAIQVVTYSNWNQGHRVQ
jgi:hypothetical protein